MGRKRGGRDMYLEERIVQMNLKLKQLEGKRNIFVWGAAENTIRLLQYTILAQFLIKGFVDNGKAGEQFFGKTVKAPWEVSWNEVDAVVISSFYHENSIAEELCNKYRFIGVVVKLNEIGQETPFYAHLSQRDIQVLPELQPILKRNRIFKNIHKNKRLFILCCGPSIQKMDLTVLKNEITMAVSCFYLHKDIETIQPTYYCSARWNGQWSGEAAENLGLKYVREIKEYTRDSQYFFSVHDKEMIDKSKAFGLNEVYYYDCGVSGSVYEEFDFCQKIMPIQSVPILCLQLALYMGFQEIYLLGTEHDSLVTGKYSYFYSYYDSVVSQENGATDSQGNLNDTFESQLECTHTLWEQYKIVKKIAEKQGIKIYNATPSGVLDIFERVDFKALWNDCK